MPFRPDIVVTPLDSPEVLLVVEVKTNGFDLNANETQLKAYMARMSCPVGILVTPAQTRFYRNRYTGFGLETIQVTGECPTSELLPGLSNEPVKELDLERRVQQWLENLRLGTAQFLPPSVREAIESSVMPVVQNGSVRAGGPRWRKTGS